MPDWTTYKGEGPWSFTQNPNRLYLNEGDRFGLVSDPVWPMTPFTGEAMSPRPYRLGGYWFKDYTAPVPVCYALTRINRNDQGWYAHGVGGDGTFIYLANYSGGLKSFSVDGSGILTFIDRNDPGGEFEHVWCQGGYIFVADSDHAYTHIFSADGVGNLTHLDSDDHWRLGEAYSIWGEGNLIYTCGPGGNAKIVSYSYAGGTLVQKGYHNPGGSGNWPNHHYGVHGDGTYVYLANCDGGLHSYTVDPSTGAFTHIDSDDQGGHANDVFCQDGLIFVANGSLGLCSYISSGGMLTLLDSNNECADARGVWGDGTLIYVADWNGGLHVYSYDDAGALTHQDSDDPGSYAEDVYCDGTFIYLANNANGLYSFSSAEVSC